MSAINRPNIYVNFEKGKLQESYLVKKQRFDKKKALDSKELVNKIHPENEEYSSPLIKGGLK